MTLTNEDRKLCEDMAAEGKYIRDYADAAGVSYQSAYARAARWGVRFNRNPNPIHLNSCTSLKNLAKLRKIAKDGLSQSTAADIMGVTRERIRQIANEYSIEFTSGHYNWDSRSDVVALHAEGLTCTEISRKAGVSDSSVRSWLIEAGLEPNRKERTSKYLADIERLAFQGLTVSEVAEAIGIHQVNVSRLKSKYGIHFPVDGRSKRFQSA